MGQSSELLDNPFSETDDDKLLPQGSIEIYRYINELNEEREPRIELSASSMSRCYKANWYQYNGYESLPLNPRAGLVFILGDVTEHVMKYLIASSCVGEGKLYSEVDFGEKTGEFVIQHRKFDTFKQETLEIPMSKEHVISGHADGWGKRNSDGQWELIEIKSAATFGFDKFKRGEVPDYIKQCHTLCLSTKAKALKVKGMRFFYMNKNTSHVFDRFYHFDKAIALKVYEEFWLSISEDEPERPYELVDETYYKKKTGRKIAAYPCSYCSYVTTCFDGLKREVNKDKPVWVLKES